MESPDLTAIRQHLHQHPELSGEEEQTCAFLESTLRKWGVKEMTRVAKTGLLVNFGSTAEGPLILLRSDHDALPIPEAGDQKYRSRTEGVSHKCGHDGHTAIMLGVAWQLTQNPPQRGRVCLLFQPAEETGQGARKVLEDPAFALQPDWVFALHNLPGFPLHQVVCCRGTFSAAARSLIFKFEGIPSHAGEPEKGINPSGVISQALQLASQLSQPDSSCEDFRLVTPVFVTLGERAYGTSAGYGETHFTLRSWKTKDVYELDDHLEKILAALCENQRIKMSSERLEEFHANINHSEAYRAVRKAARARDLLFRQPDHPFKWGEDFGLISEKFRGAMFGLGAGEDTPALHHPDYDFPDALIPTGVKMFTQLIDQILE